MAATYEFKGKTAIVTGASRGIGRAVALGLAQGGANVVLAARTSLTLEAAQKDVEAVGAKALAVETDVTKSAQVENLVRRTLDAFGRIDILVSNAGASYGPAFGRGPLLDITEQDFDECVALNFKSAFLCGRAVAPTMLQQGHGSIVNVSSFTAQALHGTRPGFAIYGSAKAAVINLTWSMAAEWAPVRVNCVVPGFIDSPRPNPTRTPEANAERVKAVALSRFGRPDEAAAAILFLASDAASYVNGATLEVSGGLRSPLPPVEPVPRG